MRSAKDFWLGISIIKTLFCALIHRILEYGVVFWYPHTTDDSRRLERFRGKFLRFANIVLKTAWEPHDYTLNSNYLGLSSLAEPRRTTGVRFLTA